MYQEFYINKQSGTYSETLETFGVANLLYEILQRNEVKGFKVNIQDKGLYYLVSSNKEITEDLIAQLSYFQIIKFIKKELTQELPEGVIDYFDYPQKKAIKDDYNAREKEIEKIKQDDIKKQARKLLNEEKLSEFGQKIDAEYDVYREIIKNPYVSYTKLFDNFYHNQNNFQNLVKEIFNYYSNKADFNRAYHLGEEKPTSQQLFNPNQGKGLNKNKANNASMSNLNSHWITETMKLSGAFSSMICQYVKVGSTYDMKIFVPEFHDISLSAAKKLVFDFKKYLKSATPIKLDILNIIDLTTKFIEKTPEYNRGKVKNTIKGFHSVYQKDLGQNRAVANIAFINTPDFVTYQNKEQGHDWIEILQQQRNLISNIEELGNSIQGLQHYRNFLGSLENTALVYFNKFSNWYAGYLMQQLTNGNKYVRTFKIEHLNKLYNYMETNLSEIISNEGFKAVATAIRKSTVTLQYTPKDQRQFEIRYGLAQQLQNKSKSTLDLATFIGEFIGTYNAETARFMENELKRKERGSIYNRAIVRDNETALFYELLDKNPSRLVGALLASYGFALPAKDKNVSDNTPEEDPNTNETEN